MMWDRPHLVPSPKKGGQRPQYLQQYPPDWVNRFNWDGSGIDNKSGEIVEVGLYYARDKFVNRIRNTDDTDWMDKRGFFI